MAVAPRGPSRTALLTAAARALHREEPPPWVLDDPLALRLAGEEGLALIEQLRSEVPGDAMLSFNRWIAVRARLPEDVVARAMADGVGQYVILGAGLDSFAYRRKDLQSRLRVFEVDHPASQAWKRRRLDELGIEVPANLVFTPVDFESQTLREGLEASGFDFAERAVFSWIGVTMYLTLDAIRATLATIAACPAGSRIVLTYNRPRAALTGLGRALDTALGTLAADVGEPFVSLFEPAEIERLLREHGFDDVVHFGPDEAIQTYFPGRTDVAFAGAQRLVVATVAGDGGRPRGSRATISTDMGELRGSVEAIFLARSVGVLPHEVSSAVAHAGRGLEGDRYYNDPEACDITLVESEALEKLQSEHGVVLRPGESRRQVHVRHVQLADFIGRRFRVGEIECEGEEHCEPCQHLVGLVGTQKVLKGLLHTGLRATIVKGGTIRTGDPVGLSPDAV